MAPTDVQHPVASGARVISEFGEAVRQLRALVADAPAAVVAARHSRWRALVLLVWVAGIAGDAMTTVLMMHSGVSEEGNPIAAAGMSVIGVGGYTAVASLLCLGFASGAVARPRGTYARTVVAVLVFLGVAKCWQGISNALLWVDVTRSS